MTSALKNFWKSVVEDIANQHACPVKSLAGSIVSRLNERKTRYVKKAAVDAISISPGDSVLEIGYGRGHGLQLAHQKVRGGNGVVFGVERSSYMREIAEKRFALEIADEKSIRLDNVLYLSNLPFPSDFFSGIFHVDSFYFWDDLFEVCCDLARVLKPGGVLACGMELRRLRRLSKWYMIDESLCNPNRYLLLLEPAGFTDVKMEYFTGPRGRDFQLITARKPLASASYYDPEERMKQLEMDIKKEMLMVRLLKERRPLSDSIDDHANDGSHSPKQ